MNRFKKPLLWTTLTILLMSAATTSIWHYRHRKAEWTIMVYMSSNKQNANTLEQAALCDFYDMASAKSSPRVNIVVQLARPGETPERLPCQHGVFKVPKWSGMGRFHIHQGDTPDPVKALQPIDKSVNMADPKTLEDFVAWAMGKFQANHYMLVFFNHGDGVELGKPGDVPQNLALFQTNLDKDLYFNPQELTKHSHNDHPFEFVIEDDMVPQADKKLAMTQIEKSLSFVLKGRKLDIIGFNACLMAMVENAYALRKVGEYMVASEELIPEAGWPYKPWLDILAEHPTLGPEELAWHLVDTFKNVNKDPNSVFLSTTESIVDLSKMELLGGAIDKFVQTYLAQAKDLRLAATIARNNCNTSIPNTDKCAYSSGVGGVDLGFFLSNMEALAIKSSARVTAASSSFKEKRFSLYAALLGAITGNYASEQSRRELGSNGIAIYFPLDRCSYLKNREAAGYSDKKELRSDFDSDHHWRRFLEDALQASQPGAADKCAAAKK